MNESPPISFVVIFSPSNKPPVGSASGTVPEKLPSCPSAPFRFRASSPIVGNPSGYSKPLWKATAVPPPSTGLLRSVGLDPSKISKPSSNESPSVSGLEPSVPRVFSSLSARLSPSLSASAGFVGGLPFTSSPSLIVSPSVSATPGFDPWVNSPASSKPSLSVSELALVGSEPKEISSPSSNPSPSVSTSSGSV